MGGSRLDGFAPRSVERHGDRSVSRAFGFHRRLDGRFEYFGPDPHYRHGQKFTLDSLGIVFNLEEAMNVRRTLLLLVDISAVRR